MKNTSRYEVTAPMPGRDFAHLFEGDILYPKFHPLAPNQHCWGHYEETDPLRWVTFCPDYPHLFRLLKWWEHVPVDELPKYVRVVDGDGEVEYINVKEWNLTKPNNHYCEGKLFTVDEIDAHGDLFTWFFPYEYSEELTPATEAEYNEYLNKLNEK